MSNLGKAFENKFKDDWKACFPQSFIYRLPDQMSGYRGSSQNLCDFVCFNKGVLYLVECKSHAGASFPFDKLTQYVKLKEKYDEHVVGTRVGVLLWLYDKDKVLYVPIKTIIDLKEKGEKSIGVRHLNKDVRIIEIPIVKKRVFVDSDFSVLMNLEDGD